MTVVEAGVTRHVNYNTDGEGQILRRYNTDAAGANPSSYEYFYYFEGIRQGDVGTDGLDTSNYARVINNRHVSGGGGYGADFDQAFEVLRLTGSTNRTPPRLKGQAAVVAVFHTA